MLNTEIKDLLKYLFLNKLKVKLSIHNQDEKYIGIIHNLFKHHFSLEQQNAGVTGSIGVTTHPIFQYEQLKKISIYIDDEPEEVKEEMDPSVMSIIDICEHFIQHEELWSLDIMSQNSFDSFQNCLQIKNERVINEDIIFEYKCILISNLSYILGVIERERVKVDKNVDHIIYDLEQHIQHLN